MLPRADAPESLPEPALPPAGSAQIVPFPGTALARSARLVALLQVLETLRQEPEALDPQKG